MKRRLDRNILDLVTGVVAFIGVVVVTLPYIMTLDGFDWSDLQVLVTVATIVCPAFICYEAFHRRYAGSSKFAALEVGGAVVVGLATCVLLTVDFAAESGLFLSLSYLGYTLIIVGVIGNWCCPLGDQRPKLHFDPRCKP